MMAIPLRYHLRSLLVRRAATGLTVLGIGATVAVLAGVLALEQGFSTLFTESGRENVAVFMRPGATNEGDSLFSRARGEDLIKSLPEIAVGETGQPLAALESYLAVRLFKVGGGETNVPIRGVQQGADADQAHLRARGFAQTAQREDKHRRDIHRARKVRDVKIAELRRQQVGAQQRAVSRDAELGTKDWQIKGLRAATAHITRQAARAKG